MLRALHLIDECLALGSVDNAVAVAIVLDKAVLNKSVNSLSHGLDIGVVGLEYQRYRAPVTEEKHESDT